MQKKNNMKTWCVSKNVSRAVFRLKTVEKVLQENISVMSIDPFRNTMHQTLFLLYCDGNLYRKCWLLFLLSSQYEPHQNFRSAWVGSAPNKCTQNKQKNTRWASSMSKNILQKNYLRKKFKARNEVLLNNIRNKKKIKK